MLLSSRTAFTLIELLVVVAIISILSSIAVPNFLEAQTRAKVSRIKADQRTMATALESYAVDNNKYPYRRDDPYPTYPHYTVPPLKTKMYDPAQPTAAVGLHLLTTPMSYLGSVPSDVFNKPVRAMMQPGNPYSDAIDYYDSVQADSFVTPAIGLKVGCAKGWLLVSVGPDQYIGVNAAGAPGGYPPEPELTQFKRKIVYDPTNGTVSSGNIFRSPGNLDQKDLVP